MRALDEPIFPPDIAQRLRLLGIVRTIFAGDLWTMIRSGSSQEIRERVDGEATGIELLTRQLALSLPKRPEPATILTQNQLAFVASLVLRDPILQRIEQVYGPVGAKHFRTASLMMLASTMGSHLCGERAYSGAGEREEYRTYAREGLQQVAELLDENRFFSDLVFGLDFVEGCRRLSRAIRAVVVDDDAYPEFHTALGEAIAAIYPHWVFLKELQTRAYQLRQALAGCPTGKEHFRKYEVLCEDILEFVFIPTLRSVRTQARTVDGLHRRDAILTNTRHDGFWETLRQELDCKHVVCEFKNWATANKDAVEQLRIYLMRKSIGRFGIILCRKTSRPMIEAQRCAYRDNPSMYIMVLDDALVGQLLDCRVYLGGPDVFLEEQKYEFEVAF